MYDVFDWPKANAVGFLYSKTPTVLTYDGTNVTAWGWAAELESTRKANVRTVRRFKLHLAPEADDQLLRSIPLPPGVGLLNVIAEYLTKITTGVLERVSASFGGDEIRMQHVQWCITVPAIWTEDAKTHMQQAAEMAGLVQGEYARAGEGSPFPLLFALEPEAAVLYCLHQLQDRFDKFVMEEYIISDAMST